MDVIVDEIDSHGDIQNNDTILTDGSHPLCTVTVSRMPIGDKETQLNFCVRTPYVSSLKAVSSIRRFTSHWMFLGRCTFKEAVATSVDWNYVILGNGMMMTYKRRPSYSLIALLSRIWIYSVSAIRIRVIPDVIYLGIIHPAANKGSETPERCQSINGRRE